MDAAQFRQDFPEFTDTAKYPDSAVNMWMGLAIKVLPPLVWLDYLDVGIELYTAHNLTIAARNQATAALGGLPGEVKGPMTGKTVDKVSASYGSGLVALSDGGYYNQTTYGIQLLQLARMVGTASIQL